MKKSLDLVNLPELLNMNEVEKYKITEQGQIYQEVRPK